MDKKQARLRRARKTRARIAELKMARLSVHRTNCHIYAQIIDETGSRVLAQRLPRWKPRSRKNWPMAATLALQP